MRSSKAEGGEFGSGAARFPSLRFAGAGAAERRTSAQHQAVATAVEARAVSYAVSPNNEWNDFFWEEGWGAFEERASAVLTSAAAAPAKHAGAP